MIQSRPRSNALFAVGLFIILTLAVDGWILAGLITDPSSYFMAKLILVPTLLVIGIIVASKSYFSAMTLTLGNDRLTYQYPFGPKKKHKISEVAAWEETVIKRKSSTYKRLTIRLTGGKKLHLSNQENSDYDKVLKYLKKKVKSGR